MILIMTNYIQLLTMCYMELNMRRVDLLSHLDSVICTIKMFIVLYVDAEGSLLLS